MEDILANEAFERAFRRSLWRKWIARLTHQSNELLPYDQVRYALPYSSQRDIGLQSVSLDRIVGSVGRYRDFDRAFLPTQRQTTDRWVNIRKAHYQDIILPPVDLYKIGDVYFVKDGNHRVSVARDRNQAEIDAFVTEIEIPFALTPDMDIDSVESEKAHANFLKQTGLDTLRPGAAVRLSNPEEYGRLHEHINSHRYYLGTERQADVAYPDAVASWYDSVYTPLVEAIHAQELDRRFPELSLSDLYLRISEYQWLLREAAQDTMGEDQARTEAMARMAGIYQQRVVRRIIRTLRHSTWLDDMIRDSERATFLERTRLDQLRPEANVVASLPGKYEKILQHIDVHKYYLGVEQGRDVPYPEAVVSWYERVYLPLVLTIREQGVLENFPGRTETDAYVWMVDHRAALEAGGAQDSETQNA